VEGAKSRGSRGLSRFLALKSNDMEERLKNFFWMGFAAVLVLANFGFGRQNAPFRESKLEKKIVKEISIRYLIHLPEGYEGSKQLFPLLLYLHGGQGRGDDFQKLSWYPIPKMILTNKFPNSLIAVIPQCPEGKVWEELEDALVAVIDEIANRYRVDASRIYGIGYSMGGNGIVHLAYTHPDIFAAIAPMSGYYFTWWVSRLKDIPAWFFHGAKDSPVSLKETDEMVEEYKKLGGEVKYSRDPEGGHRPPSEEQHLEVLEWLLKHSKK
jgi:predicted peptidase